MRAQAFILSSLAALPWVAAAANTASTTSSCAVFGTPQSASYTCDQSGSLRSPSPIGAAEQNVSSALDCGILCQETSSCLSFSYDTNTNACQLYGKSLPSQDFTASNTTTPVKYYNVHCLACPSSTTSTAKPTQSTISATQSSSSTAHATSAKASVSAKSTISVTSAGHSTSTTPATSTKTSASPTATNHNRCAQTTFSADGSTYTRYFMGAGKTESPNNRGNDNSAEPAITNTLDGSYYNDCDAIQACAALAGGRSMTYYSFDIHWLSDTMQWVCVQYYDPNTDAGAFNVTNKKAYVAYGFVNLNY